MAAFELEGVEIDHCIACRGTWLDEGELEQILTLAGITDAERLEELERAGDGRAGRRRCPRCPRKLREVAASVEQALLLDRCPQCRGLWLDRGEMETLIRSEGPGADGADAVAEEVARFFGELYRAELETESGE
jgi:Zn-finger nucleic acid-binding protein